MPESSSKRSMMKTFLHVEEGDPSVEKKAIRIEYDNAEAFLEISLRRTIRVPDNGKPYDLPPDCGAFPIYSVTQFKDDLPAELVAKGGCFIAMYQKEAMWIRFESQWRFSVKVFVGGVNAVSGEPCNENLATMLRRHKKLASSQTIQDYVVVGDLQQQWLDGVVSHDGKVMQFVAMPEGSGYSVEAQVTGSDEVGGMQFEIIPLKHVSSITVTVIVPKEMGWKELRYVGQPTTQIRKLIEHFCERFGKREAQLRFFLRCDGPDDPKRIGGPGDTFDSVGVEDGGTIEVYEEQIGGGSYRLRQPSVSTNVTMSVAAGGLIKQTIIKDSTPADMWDIENTILVNLELINAASFARITGLKPLPSPVTASTYAKHGYPFCSIYEEPSGVKGDFKGLKSIAMMEKEIRKSIPKEKDLHFPVVTLATAKSSFVPVSEMVRRMKTVKVANDL